MSESDESSTRQRTTKVANLWGEVAEARTAAPMQGWLDAPLVMREWVHPLLHGNPDDDWLTGLGKRLRIAPHGHWLSLGCGSAGTEIEARRRRVFGSMGALAVAPRAIDEGRRAAAAQGVDGIEFGVVDFNRLVLPPERFDVVMMCMSLHHVTNLRAVLGTIRQALKPDGHLLVNEYVGPRQLQFTDAQLDATRDLLATLPARLRRDCTTGGVKTEYRRLPVEHWNLVDPSEAIRSDRIVPLLYRCYDVVLQLDYGGSVLNPLLEHIVHNFDHGQPEGVGALLRLCH